MNLCSHNHEEICYESRNCPLCEFISDKESEIDKLTDQIHGLESELSDAQAEISSLQQQIP